MRAFITPVAILILLAAGSVWHSHAIGEYTENCITGIDDAIRFSTGENWPAVRAALTHSHTHWEKHRSYLRITTAHSTVDAANSMYSRAKAFAETEEITEFRAETAGLRMLLLQLAETESLLLENIL
jgi:hypothetical protein